MAPLGKWLEPLPLASGPPKYRIRLLKENRKALPEVLEALKLYTDEALNDARMRIRRGFEDSLSPFNDFPPDPAANFPAQLHQVTLQGYFGETLAGLVVEHLGAHGHDDWVVPAFLFRTHEVEFQHLDAINEKLASGEAHDPDARKEKRPGRTGDDALAFRINKKGEITDVLSLEAKCLAQNNAGIIQGAHQKLSSAGVKPSGVRELINLLAEYTTPEAKVWQKALIRYWVDGHKKAKRHDGILYGCGHAPVKGKRRSWLPETTVHADYTCDRNLDGTEIHFNELDELIRLVYRT